MNNSGRNDSERGGKMATIEPNREWFEDRAGRGKIRVEWPDGEVYIYTVERGESDD